MARPIGEITFVQFYIEYKEFVVGLIIKLGGLYAIRNCKDLEQDVYTRMLEYDYLRKYDPEKSEFEDFIYQVVRTIVYNNARSRETSPIAQKCSFEDSEQEDYFWNSLFSDVSLATEVEQEIFVESVRTELKRYPSWGRASVVVNGKLESYERSFSNLFDLLMKNYKKNEIAKLFGVTGGSISQYCCKLRVILVPMLKRWGIDEEHYLAQANMG